MSPIRRLIQVTGPLQLLNVLSVLRSQAASGEYGDCEDYLMLTSCGLYGHPELYQKMHALCWDLASIWNFKVMFSLYDLEGQFDAYQIDFAQAAEAVRHLTQIETFDVVYTFDYWFFTNEVIHAAYPQAYKICYGDSFGWVGPLRPHMESLDNLRYLADNPQGYFLIDKACLLTPLEHRQNAFKQFRELEIIDFKFFRSVITDVAKRVEGLEAYCQEILAQCQGKSVVLAIISCFTEAEMTRDVPEEVAFYLECILPFTRPDEVILIKSHPRERFQQAQRLAEQLRQLRPHVLILSNFAQLPIELFLPFLSFQRLVTPASAAVVSLGALSRCELVMGVSPQVRDRYMINHRDIFTYALGLLTLVLDQLNRQQIQPIFYAALEQLAHEFHDYPLHQQRPERKARCRLVIVQGPLQLLMAIALLRSQTVPGEPCEDILAIAGLHSSPKSQQQMVETCVQLASLWNFKSIVTPDLFDLLEDLHQQQVCSFRTCVDLLRQRLQLFDLDAVYTCRNWQFVNELGLALNPNAQRICYGDGYGWLDLKSTNQTGACNPVGFLPMQSAFLMAPVELESGAFAQTVVNQIAPDPVQTVLQEARGCIQGLESYCQTLRDQFPQGITLILTSNDTEAGWANSLTAELQSYLACILPQVQPNQVLLIKPHPRQQFGQAEHLADLLQQRGYQAQVVPDCWQVVPVELMAPLLQPIKAIICGNSASTVSLAYLCNCDLSVGYGRQLLNQYYHPEGHERSLRLESLLATLARQARQQRFEAIAYSQSEQVVAHDYPIQIADQEAATPDSVWAQWSELPLHVEPELQPAATQLPTWVTLPIPDAGLETVSPFLPTLIAQSQRLQYALVAQMLKGKRVLDISVDTSTGGEWLIQGGPQQVIRAYEAAESLNQAVPDVPSSTWQVCKSFAHYLPQFPDQSFDWIVACDRLTDLTQPQRFLEELRRLLKPGGQLLVSWTADDQSLQKLVQDVFGDALFLRQDNGLSQRIVPMVVNGAAPEPEKTFQSAAILAEVSSSALPERWIALVGVDSQQISPLVQISQAAFLDIWSTCQQQHQDVKRLQQELMDSQQQLTVLEARYAEMAASKFWKLREVWMGLKQKVRQIIRK